MGTLTNKTTHYGTSVNVHMSSQSLHSAALRIRRTAQPMSSAQRKRRHALPARRCRRISSTALEGTTSLGSLTAEASGRLAGKPRHL